MPSSVNQYSYFPLAKPHHLKIGIILAPSYYTEGRQKLLERMAGIEPAQPAWKAGVLLLNYIRICAAGRKVPGELERKECKECHRDRWGDLPTSLTWRRMPFPSSIPNWNWGCVSNTHLTCIACHAIASTLYLLSYLSIYKAPSKRALMGLY